MNIPLYRAYDKKTKAFITRGYLNADNVFFDWALIARDNIEVDLFTGKVANDGTPIYQNDLVAYDFINEFGSAISFEGIIRYDPHLMRYVLNATTTKQEAGKSYEGMLNIKKVIGHNHD